MVANTDEDQQATLALVIQYEYTSDLRDLDAGLLCGLCRRPTVAPVQFSEETAERFRDTAIGSKEFICCETCAHREFGEAQFGSLMRSGELRCLPVEDHRSQTLEALTVVCPFCAEAQERTELPRGLLVQHLREECKHFCFPCPYRAIGCTFSSRSHDETTRHALTCARKAAMLEEQERQRNSRRCKQCGVTASQIVEGSVCRYHRGCWHSYRYAQVNCGEAGVYAQRGIFFPPLFCNTLLYVAFK